MVSAVLKSSFTRAMQAGRATSTCGIRSSRGRFGRAMKTTCLAQGYEKEIIQEGSGPTPTVGQQVAVHYTGAYVDAYGDWCTTRWTRKSIDR